MWHNHATLLTTMSTTMTATRPLRIRVNARDSVAAEKVLRRYGLTAREGVNMFFAQVARRGTIPLNFTPYDTDDGYPPHTPNAKTQAAIDEDLSDAKGYATVEDAMAALRDEND